MQITREVGVNLHGCIAPAVRSHLKPSTAVSIVFLSFCLGGGGVSLFLSLRAAENHHQIEKVIIVGKKHQESMNHHQLDRRSSFVFDFYLPGPTFIHARDFFLFPSSEHLY